MKLVTALIRRFVQLRETLFSEPTLAVQQVVSLLAKHPGSFEVCANPDERGRVCIQLRQANAGDLAFRGTVMEGGRICLYPDSIMLALHSQLPSELHRRDRMLLLQAVQAWLPTYN